jgi:dTDP-4-dehydrorhamnose reductase
VARLLITGGSGYLGSAVASLASAAGWSVTSASFRRPGPAQVDIRDAGQVAALVEQVRPDAVVHAAYQQDGDGAWPVIVDGSANVAATVAAAGARLVHLSTDVVFDGRSGAPYGEDDEPSPIIDYGRAKLEAERRVAAAAPAAVLVRTSLIYGGPGGPVSKHEQAATAPGGAFYVDELRCPVQVDDLAVALVELCGLDVTGPLHVAGPEPVSRWQLACLAAGREVTGVTAPPGRPLDCRLDSSRATGMLLARLRGVYDVFGVDHPRSGVLE